MTNTVTVFHLEISKLTRMREICFNCFPMFFSNVKLTELWGIFFNFLSNWFLVAKHGRQSVWWKTECFCIKCQGGAQCLQYILCVCISLIYSFYIFQLESQLKIFGKKTHEEYSSKIDPFGTLIQTFRHLSHGNHLLTKNDINI